MTHHLLILSNRNDTVLHAVVRADLTDFDPLTADSFSARYHLTKVVYHASFPDEPSARARCAQILRWSRAKKEALVSASNPARRDLRPRPPLHRSF